LILRAGSGIQTDVAVRTRERSCLIILGALGRGGAERQATLVASALSEAGVRVRVFVATPPLELARDFPSDVSVSLPNGREGLLRQLRRLRACFEDNPPDAALTFLGSAGMRLLLARWTSEPVRRTPFIASERGNYHASSVFRHPVGALLRSRYMRAADVVVVNSSSLAANVNSFDSTLGTRLEIVPNIVLPAAPDAHSVPDEVTRLLPEGRRGPFLVSLGSFQDDRNHELLADALAVVLAAYPDAHLVTIGRVTGPECAPAAARFRAAICRLGIESHVTIAGEIPAARRLLSTFDVAVFPSKLEGSSNALVEALVSGCAIAATPVADSEGLLAGAGAVSTGWTAASLGAAVVFALRNRDDLRRRARARGAELATERSPAAIAARWREVIEQAVARVRPNGP
jgi:glycosyltransferase involved in cell wall biosynthesis